MGNWRDLNRNGRLDPYEDPSAPLEDRIDDLLGQMTLAEKAGQMMHTIAFLSDVDIPGLPSAADLISRRAMTHFNVMGTAPARRMAEWYNSLAGGGGRDEVGNSSNPLDGPAPRGVKQSRDGDGGRRVLALAGAVGAGGDA